MQRKLLSWMPGNKKEPSEDSGKKKKPKSVGLFSGFFFNINYIVGTGFLSVPYGFYRAGTLTGTITLLALSFVSWNAANWIIESMSRSQVSYKNMYFNSWNYKASCFPICLGDNKLAQGERSRGDI